MFFLAWLISSRLPKYLLVITYAGLGMLGTVMLMTGLYEEAIRN